MSAPPDPEDRLHAGLAAPLFTADEWGAYLRVRTPFTLPDGDPLVLFLLRHSDPPLLGDLGETLRWLRSHTIEPRRSTRQQQQISDACASLDVTLERGELRTTTRPDESLAAAAVRVAQACLRVSDLRRSGRPRITRSFPDEVESYLRAKLPGPLAITRNDRIPGISATTWSVDFRVRTPRRHLLLFLLANERRDQARKLAEHVVAACTDLAHLRKLRRMPVQFITIFDDRGAAWNDGDARLVAPFATPHRWSERTTWVPALADPDLEDPNDEDDDDENENENENENEEHSHEDPPDREDPPMTPHLRPATPDDYAEFARMFPELGTGDPIPDEDAWTGHLHDSTLMLVEGAQILGYAYFERMAEFGYVRNVVIDPAQRGRGRGRTLMLHLAEHLRALGCTRWCLNVEPGNTVALALYRSLGLDVVYRSAALRFLWSAVEALSGEDLSLETCPVDPSEDAEIEAAHELPVGQLAAIREDPSRILQRLHDPADPTALGLGIASFNPHFPGAFPFRVARPGLARALLLGLHPHALPDEPHMHVVVEDDEPLRALLLEIGAVLRMQLLFLRGDLP